MENYEKKYKEALELAKEILKTRCITGTNGAFYRKDIEDMFPELKESEDEKIRKWLIRDMQNCLEEGAYDGEDIAYAQKAIAWLEKQKPVEWSEDDEAFLDDIICKVESDLILNKDEKNWLKSLIDRVQPQQKPEWIEEDIAIIGRIRSIIEKYAFSQSAVDVNGELCEREYIELDEWLKSLKDRVLPQPKQEWSEEDEKHIRSILSRLDSTFKDVFTDSPFTISEDIDWLESLHPKSHWKPSDEQITNAAREWIYNHKEGDKLYVKDAFVAGAKWVIGQLKAL